MKTHLHNKSCFEYLNKCGPFKMAFADPPDSIGLKYQGFKDSFSDMEYEAFLTDIVRKATAKCDVLWLSLNSKHACVAGSVLHNALKWLNAREDLWTIKHCVQTFTFYQHNHNDLGNAHRVMYRIMRTNMPLYPDQVRVPSWRQLNGDKRADPRGKVPGDVFDIPRVTGNSKQRRAYSPTQLNEDLYERCIKLCCTPGDVVVDLFAGSGTLGRVAEKCGVNAVMVEISEETCKSIAQDQNIERIK